MPNMRIGGNLEEVADIEGSSIRIKGPTGTGDTTTQTLQAHLGAVATPSITFAADKDTGFYRKSADVIGIGTGGTEIGTFTSAGFVPTSGLSAASQTDGVVWIPATSLPAIYLTTGTWTNTRIAAADYAWVKTATDETSTIEIPLNANLLTRSTASTGLQVLGLRYVNSAVTEALDAHTYDLTTALYANSAATTIASTFGGTLTGTLPTAADADPQVTAITTGTDTYLTTLSGLYFVVTANAAASTVYKVHGVFFDVAYLY